MHSKPKQTSDGPSAVNIENVGLDEAHMPDGFDAEEPFNEEEHNASWDTDPDSTTRCRTWDELDRRNSYEFEMDYEANLPVRIYEFGEYGKLSAMVIDGMAWCSLGDAARIAGVPHHEITGWLNDNGAHIRGKPGYLEPDEVLFISKGFLGTSIRIEALMPVFMKARAGRALTEYLVGHVIPHIYTACTSECVGFQPAADHAFDGKLQRLRHYDSLGGEVRLVFLGNTGWFNLSDISRLSGFTQELIARVVGESQAVTIPYSDLDNSDGSSGSETYIQFKAFCQLLNATESLFSRAIEFEWWMAKLLTATRQLESGRFVYASTLHQMLGQHMSFSDWVSATDSKDSSIAFRKEILTANGTEPGDFKVPLTEALEIAKREGGPAGELVSILIRDGGFLHGGPVTEPIDSTLRRLQGLMPDHLGRVSARCVHKFTNKGEPFEAWVEAEEKSGSENSTLRDELISLDEAEIRGIWDTNTRYYCEMWCPSYPA